MRYLRKILFPIFVTLLVCLVFTSGCSESESEERLDIPRYTADQVIAVANSNSPTFTKIEQYQYACEETPVWNVEYQGEGIWLVMKYATQRFTGEKIYVKSWYFSENTGQLNRREMQVTELKESSSGTRTNGNSTETKDTAYDEGYQDGYEKGHKEGYNEGYDVGYQDGFDESTRLFGPKDELVEIVSYELTRDSSLWVEVVGELQNISNRTLLVEVTCALLDNNGTIVATSESYDTFSQRLEPQQKAFFTFDSFFQQPTAVDARFTVVWTE
jgi:flagellar biosynthesis/type III secretory pathway protein FliH